MQFFFFFFFFLDRLYTFIIIFKGRQSEAIPQLALETMEQQMNRQHRPSKEKKHYDGTQREVQRTFGDTLELIPSQVLIQKPLHLQILERGSARQRGLLMYVLYDVILCKLHEADRPQDQRKTVACTSG